MKTVPIILFVYSRLHHTKKTVQALAGNYLADKSHLYIFSDAARNDTDRQAVDSVREYIKTITGFYSVSIIEREKNFGLADSIISGVTQIINEHGRAIVLEDDLVTSKFFLRYMNAALEKYEYEEKIMHIAGHMMDVDPTGLPEAFFLRPSSCWGWGTWSRAWRHFQRDSEALLARFTPADISRFNLDGFFDYWVQVRANHSGAIRTWAIFWYASVFLNGGLCLHPRTTMVANIGHDGSGENCRVDIRFDQSVAQAPVTEFPDAPKDLWEHPVAMRRYQLFLSGEGGCR